MDGEGERDGRAVKPEHWEQTGALIREAMTIALEGLHGSPAGWVAHDEAAARAHVLGFIRDYAAARGVIVEPADVLAELDAIIERIKRTGR